MKDNAYLSVKCAAYLPVSNYTQGRVVRKQMDMRRYVFLLGIIAGLSGCSLGKSEKNLAHEEYALQKGPTIVRNDIGNFFQRQHHVPVTRLVASFLDIQNYPQTSHCSITHLQKTLEKIQLLQEHTIQYYVDQLEQQMRRSSFPDVKIALYPNPLKNQTWDHLAHKMSTLIHQMTQDGVLIYSTQQIQRYNASAQPNRQISSKLLFPTPERNTLVLACGVRIVQLYLGQDWLVEQQAKLSPENAAEMTIVTFTLSAQHAIYAENIDAIIEISAFKEVKKDKLRQLPPPVHSINHLFEKQLYSKLQLLKESPYLLPQAQPTRQQRLAVHYDCISENISACTVQQHANQRILYLEYTQMPWLYQFIRTPSPVEGILQKSLMKSETSPFIQEK